MEEDMCHNVGAIAEVTTIVNTSITEYLIPDLYCQSMEQIIRFLEKTQQLSDELKVARNSEVPFITIYTNTI